MKKAEKKLDDILEECLQDIKTGRATRDECLLRYKEQASDLAPLLHTAVQLLKLPSPRISERRMVMGRQRILQKFVVPVRFSWLGVRRAFLAPAFAISTVLTLLLFSVLGTGVYFSIFENSYPNSEVPTVSAVTQPPLVTQQPTVKFSGIGMPSRVEGPYEIAGAPDGTLWFAQKDATRVGSVSNKKIQDWDITSREGKAGGITVDGKGKVWFTVSSTQSISVLDPKIDEISTWHVGLGDGTLGRIEAGGDGLIWFIAREGSRIYSLNPDTAKFTAYDVEEAQYLEWANGALWFSGKAGQLGEITSDGQIHTFDVPGHPAAMVGDGAMLWYAGGNLLGRYDINSGQVMIYPLRDEVTIDRIATDGMKNIWFGSQGGRDLGVLQTENGQISFRPLDTMLQDLYWLTAGMNKVWVSGSDGRHIFAFSLSSTGNISLENVQSDHFATVSLPYLAVR